MNTAPMLKKFLPFGKFVVRQPLNAKSAAGRLRYSVRPYYLPQLSIFWKSVYTGTWETCDRPVYEGIVGDEKFIIRKISHTRNNVFLLTGTIHETENGSEVCALARPAFPTILLLLIWTAYVVNQVVAGMSPLSATMLILGILTSISVLMAMALRSFARDSEQFIRDLAYNKE